MARTVLNEQYYTFNPSTRVIVIPRVIQREQLLLITNVTTNTVIYNFSDNALRATAYAITGTNFQYGVAPTGATTPGKPYTTITLNFNTSSMSAADELQFIVDIEQAEFIPAEQYRDPVDKLRVSTPQSLIDTDFEYSVQPSKWENINYIWNKPSFFSKGSGGNSIDITAITGGNQLPYSTVTVTTQAAHGFAAGDVITVQETTSQFAEGTFAITSIPSGTQFTYLAKGQVNGSILATGLTTVYGGDTYDFSNIPVSAISSNVGSPSTITITTPNPHGFLPGSTILVSGSSTAGVDGNWIITSVVSPTTFSYVTATNAITASPNLTTNISTFTSATSSGATRSIITATLGAVHNFKVGDYIQVTGSSNAQLNGNWIVVAIPSTTIVSFVISTTITAGAVGSVGTATVNRFIRLFPRSEAYQQHRALDGGVSLTTSANFAGGTATRQTRRYFRYQSGKGLQFSTGAKFTPTFDITTISGSSIGAGSKTVTVTTFQDHNLQVGATIVVEGLTVGTGTNPYNGTFLVASVTGSKTFTYTITADASFNDLAPGGAESYITCTLWRGAVTRTGLFDDMNGFYYEYDGLTLYAARRWGIKEIFGTVAPVQGSTTITGTNTRFREQMVVGDKIIVRGVPYQVTRISSDTSLDITVAYRGLTPPSEVKALKVQEFRVPQSQWNLDRMDGTGPSGYNLDIKNMQMAYIDYTWYGAGFIRFGFRSTNGDIVYCHKMPNNNVNKTAYMRSGNLPGRFEATNIGPYSRVMAGVGGTKGNTVGTADTTIYLENISGWPTNTNSTNAFIISDGTNIELCTYTAINTTFNATAGGYAVSGITRRTSLGVSAITPAGTYGTVTLSGTASSFTYAPDTTIGGAGTSQVFAQYLTNTCAPNIAHWGVSVIMDGRFDDDRSIIFTTPTGNTVSVGSIAISTTSVSGSVLTITTTGNHNLVQGQFITISGNSGNINREFQVQSVATATQFTVVQVTPTISGTNNAGNIFPVRPLISIRVAPTVDNAIARNFGIREVVNRMQLTLASCGVNVTGQTCLIRGFLNPTFLTLQPSGGQSVAVPDAWEFNRVGSGSLSQVIYHVQNDSVGGGESVFGIFANNNTTTALDLTKARDLGNSIYSGNGNFRSPGYPNGPDVLTICAQPVTTTPSVILARLSWTEAQA